MWKQLLKLWRRTEQLSEAAVRSSECVLPNDYGYGYQARELINGQWVLWHGDEACDLKSQGYSWKPGTRFWKDCIGTRKEVDASAKEIMAARGVFRQNGGR